MRRTAVCATLAIIGALQAQTPTLSAQDALEPIGTVSGPIHARHLPDVTLLHEGRTTERRLERGDTHLYRLPLVAGEYVRVVIEQRGVDVVADTRTPSGDAIGTFEDDVRRDGEEQIELVSDRAGVYTIAITSTANDVAAGSYTIRIVGRRAAIPADRTLQESRRLYSSGLRLERVGKFDDARDAFERAIALSEPLRGREDLIVASQVWALAGNALERHDDRRAQQLYERAIATFERLRGADDPTTAIARSRLGLLYSRAGQGPKGEALVRRSSEIIEKAFGTDHLWYAVCLTTQGSLRVEAGDLDRAEELLRRALAILQRIDALDTIQYSAVLNNLGEIYRSKNDNARAEALYRRALEAAERMNGPISYRASTTLGNLGIVAREQFDYAAALDYDTRAIAVREQVLGADHPEMAPLLNNLAVLYHVMGDDAHALAAHFRALAIWEQSVGPYHRGTLTSVGNIARTYASLGETTKAIAFQRRADAILEEQLALNVAVGSERQKLAFVRSVAERTDRTVSLHLIEAPQNDEAAALAALVLLQRKGRVQDVMTDTFAAVRQRVADPNDRVLLDRLNDVTEQLARIALDPPNASEPRPSLAELESRREELEATLSEHSAAFRAQRQPVTLASVQAAMPADAALLEFAVYRPFDPRVDRNADAYAPPHYAVYVIRKSGTPIGVDLGPVAALDPIIDAFRVALRDPHAGDVKSTARAVDERVMQPLRRSLDGVTRLLVSPDGDLNLVPFEALIDEDGRYLVERYATNYLTSGRDLLRMRVERATPTSPIIVADPAFGEPGRDIVRTAPAIARRSVTTGADWSSVYFAPLAATGMEARAIKALFPDARLLTGPNATKTALQNVQAPRILHIASHGFFLDDSIRAAGPAGGNPLLRSGLAFAGANLTRDGHGDGILTALEASGLDLWGTKLVTLSACDTGVGEVRNGEGVYGLRRAFVLAGAETLVMSLWPVSDYIARDVIVAYYTGLRGGFGRGDALRQAKLALLHRPNRQHPFYWAGFIQSGEWADLNGKR